MEVAKISENMKLDPLNRQRASGNATRQLVSGTKIVLTITTINELRKYPAYSPNTA